MKFSLTLAALLWPFIAARQPADWEKPFPAHTIAGNLHYIGTTDLACYLITTPDGHILINTGLKSSVPQMKEGARKLGYRLEDVKILLVMQAHFDHTAGLAAIQKLSGARLLATVADTASLESGGLSDGALFNGGNRYPAVKVSRQLKDGDTISLGGTELRVILTPGHSRGSVSYAMTIADQAKTWRVLFVNLPTVVDRLTGNSSYLTIQQDFERSFAALKRERPDIWLAGHGSQFDLKGKHRAGSYIDPEGYQRAVAHHEKLYRDRLAKENKTARNGWRRGPESNR